ncbi:MAG: hypothetical protein JXR31_16310 [Prolixibacteraceae bacterium]|nr:hypothetical protein [Prolixibacteraceae bacterium]MBN2775820.1 hypothetical protein [Prolixibacteraceae bacterium]
MQNHSYGIYNNAGKLFLEIIFLKNSQTYKRICKKLYNDLEQYLKQPVIKQSEFHVDSRIVLRWASGGVLPIACIKNKKYFVLLFRDIPPIGLNIPNGASETKSEYKEIDHLIYREFCEEIVLLDDKPDIYRSLDLDTRVYQKLFNFFGGIPLNIENLCPTFIKSHQELRKEYDRIKIENKDDRPEISYITTPFSLDLHFHDQAGEKKTKSFKNILFNINPYEFGIEIIRPLQFKIEEENYFLDGEIWELGPSLVRQPVVLISVEFLKNLYQKNKTIGVLKSDEQFMNCKEIEKIPSYAFKFYSLDIELRKEFIKRYNRGTLNRDKYAGVYSRYQKWLDEYETKFSMLEENKDQINISYPLNVLCPTTWKAIETMFQYNLI